MVGQPITICVCVCVCVPAGGASGQACGREERTKFELHARIVEQKRRRSTKRPSCCGRAAVISGPVLLQQCRAGAHGYRMSLVGRSRPCCCVVTRGISIVLRPNSVPASQQATSSRPRHQPEGGQKKGGRRRGGGRSGGGGGGRRRSRQDTSTSRPHWSGWIQSGG